MLSRSQVQAGYKIASRAIAKGEPSKSEPLGVGDNEFVPWQIGIMS